jgi:hypothetical protein
MSVYLEAEDAHEQFALGLIGRVGLIGVCHIWHRRSGFNRWFSYRRSGFNR